MFWPRILRTRWLPLCLCLGLWACQASDTTTPAAWLAETPSTGTLLIWDAQAPASSLQTRRVAASVRQVWRTHDETAQTVTHRGYSHVFYVQKGVLSVVDLRPDQSHEPLALADAGDVDDLAWVEPMDDSGDASLLLVHSQLADEEAPTWRLLSLKADRSVVVSESVGDEWQQPLVAADGHLMGVLGTSGSDDAGWQLALRFVADGLDAPVRLATAVAQPTAMLSWIGPEPGAVGLDYLAQGQDLLALDWRSTVPTLRVVGGLVDGWSGQMAADETGLYFLDDDQLWRLHAGELEKVRNPLDDNPWVDDTVAGWVASGYAATADSVFDVRNVYVTPLHVVYQIVNRWPSVDVDSWYVEARWVAVPKTGGSQQVLSEWDAESSDAFDGSSNSGVGLVGVQGESALLAHFQGWSSDTHYSVVQLTDGATQSWPGAFRGSVLSQTYRQGEVAPIESLLFSPAADLGSLQQWWPSSDQRIVLGRYGTTSLVTTNLASTVAGVVGSLPLYSDASAAVDLISIQPGSRNSLVRVTRQIP